MHAKQIMKQVQKNWRQMSEAQKEYYKVQSKANRSAYDEKKREFEEVRASDPSNSQLNVIKAIQERR